MEYAFFLGCTIPARARNYEMSARRICDLLGIGLVNIKEFMCCGFPIRASDMAAAEVMAAYNMCLAQDMNLEILTLCSSCASALTEAGQRIENDPVLRRKVNEHLERAGLKFRGGTKVRHIARVLYENFDENAIHKYLKRDLCELKIAVHYGCHYLKPSEIYEGFDDAEDPVSIERLVEYTGAQVIYYKNKKKCCGGPVLPVDEGVAFSVAKEKLDNVKDAGADAICLVCPFCSVMYDGNQKGIEAACGESYNIPVLYLTQVLGIAMGFDRKELGLNMNVVKTKKLLSRYFD